MMIASISRKMSRLLTCNRRMMVSIIAVAATVGFAQDSRPVPPDDSTLVDIARKPGRAPGVDTDNPEGPKPAPVTPPPDISISPQGNVEMHVRELDLATVLQMLSMQSRRNIIASHDATGTVTANLYNVTLEEALTAILDSNNCKWQERGNFIYVYTEAEYTELQNASAPTVSRLFKLNYARAADVETLIKPLLSDQGTISKTPESDTGIATGSDDAGGDALGLEDCLIVTDRPENLDKVAAMLANIDVRPRQVLVEATILRAQLNEDNALGIDFNILGGIQFPDPGFDLGGSHRSRHR